MNIVYMININIMIDINGNIYANNIKSITLLIEIDILIIIVIKRTCGISYIIYIVLITGLCLNISNICLIQYKIYNISIIMLRHNSKYHLLGV